MALDEPADNDTRFNEKEIAFLIDKNLLNDVQPISIDYVESEYGAGFVLTSALSNKAGGCGSGCSC